MADATAALTHLTLRYIDWVTLQLMPDTAEQEWLDRHGDIWLVNADNSIGRKPGTLAVGTVTVFGIDGTTIPIATRLVGGDDWSFETTAQTDVTSSGTVVPVRSLTYGVGGNRAAGDVLVFDTAISGVTGEAPVVEIDGGIDAETDDQLRERVLRRIRQPPMGGAAYDYEAWALSVPGVTRAWAASEMGIGTVTVRFMMDDLRASTGGFPNAADIVTVTNYLNTVRPVTVKDMFVLSPIPQPIDFTILELEANTLDVRTAIKDSIDAGLRLTAAPGQTIFLSWKYSAVNNAVGVQSFVLGETTDSVMLSPGHMAVLGDLSFSPGTTLQIDIGVDHV
jgi:uncharacterized phage protein gp47/JayE